MLQNAAVRRKDVRDQIRLHQLAAVHHRTDGGGHFQIGNLTALPEGAGGQLYRPHAVGGVVQALFRLGGQVDAGGFPQAEGGKIIAESLLAQPRPDLDKALVAGVFQCLCHGLAAVALVVGAVEPRARHRDRVSAVKGGVPGDGSGIQRRRAGDELKHAARLV